MAEAPKRLTSEYQSVLPRDEADEIDRNRIVALAVGTGEFKKLELNGNESDEFVLSCRERIERIGEVDPKKHILFKDMPEEALFSTLIAEAGIWNIVSDKPLDPRAAQAILDLNERIEKMPPEIHRLHFPLFMVGYMIGHATRVAVYNALTAQAVNDNGSGLRINPEQAAIVGFLHDLGKLDEEQKKLVKKPGHFTKSEFEKVKDHPKLGAGAILTLINHEDGAYFPADLEHSSDVYEATFGHHVRPDNDPERSYPRFIPHSELSPIVKLTTLTDAYDSMTTRRFGYEQNPDVRRHDIESCFAEIEKCKGKQFDPKLTEIFLKLKPHPEIV